MVFPSYLLFCETKVSDSIQSYLHEGSISGGEIDPCVYDNEENVVFLRREYRTILKYVLIFCQNM